MSRKLGAVVWLPLVFALVCGSWGCSSDDPTFEFYVVFTEFTPDFDLEEETGPTYLSLRSLDPYDYQDLWIGLEANDVATPFGYLEFDFTFDPEIVEFAGAELPEDGLLGVPGEEVQLAVDDSVAAEGIVSFIISRGDDLEPITEVEGRIVNLLFHPLSEGRSLVDYDNNVVLTENSGDYVSGVSWYGGYFSVTRN